MIDTKHLKFVDMIGNESGSCKDNNDMNMVHFRRRWCRGGWVVLREEPDNVSCGINRREAEARPDIASVDERILTMDSGQIGNWADVVYLGMSGVCGRRVALIGITI